MAGERRSAKTQHSNLKGTGKIRFQAILEAAVDGVITIDQKGIIDTVNKAAETLFGYSREELVGRNISVLMPSPYHEAHDGYLERYQQTGERHIIGVGREVVGRRKDGSTFPVYLAVSETKFEGETVYTGFLHDLTLRKQQEQDLRICNQALKSASEGIVIADAQQPGHPIIFANPAFLQMTGYELREVLGKGCELLCGNLDSAHFSDLQDALQREQEFTATVQCARKDSSVYWNEISVAPVRNDDDETTHVVAVMEDVSDRQEAQQQLLQSERLAAIGQMVTGLAHESRNALQRAQACLDMLALDLEGQPDQLELTAKTHRALNDLHRYYEEVRNYAAPIQLERRKTDIVALWQMTWRNLDQVGSGSSIQLTESRAENLPVCTLDDHRIEQVFRNIMENAISSMPDDGRLHIDGSVVSRAGKDHVRIAFRDSGPGFRPETIEKALQPFFTTKQKGTGLGLAISKRIIDAHGGSLHLGNAPEGGAEIVVLLPVHATQTTTA